MDDISSAIQSVLNDPQSMAQIQNIMQSLGAGGTPQSAPQPAPSAQHTGGTGNPLQSLLPALNTAQNTADSPMMSMLLRAAPLLTAANQEDDATRLLAALRPLLGEARRKKLDEASRILKLLRLLPLLRESGVLQNIF